MSTFSSPATGPTDFGRAAARIIERRRLRARFFDGQFFGEHGWDLLLFLFARQPQAIMVQAAADALGVSASTITVVARLLASHGLVESGDSTGGWNEIPLRLTESGLAQIQAYLEQVELGGLAA